MAETTLDGGTLGEVTATAENKFKSKSVTSTISPNLDTTLNINSNYSSSINLPSSNTYVTKPIRKGIKVMAKVAHVANAVSQMPQPKDFALMITSDIVYMSGKVQELVKNMNTLLDSYSNIPINFLETQLNGIANTTTNLINTVNNYATDNITNALDLASNTVKLPADLINTSIDMYSSTSKTIISMSDNIEILSEVFKDKDKADEIKSNLDTALKNIDDKSADSKKKLTESLENASSKISEAKNDAIGYINDKANQIISFQNKGIQTLIDNIKNEIKSFSNSVEEMFGITSNQKASSTISNLSSLSTNDGDEFDNLASTAVAETANIANSIIENFSISKFVSACAGMTSSIILVQTGLDKLPPVNTDKILDCVNGFERSLIKSNINLDDLVQYNDEKYKKYKEQFEEDLQKQRNAIRRKMSLKKKKVNLLQELQAEKKANKEFFDGLSKDEKTDFKSAIKEIRKQRRQARKGKKANKLKDTIISELKKFYEEVKKLLNSVKKKWNDMMNNYKQSISDIKSFFTGGGSGDDTIERISDDIDKNCSDIKKLCTEDLPTQLTNISLNVTMPRALGWCFPNFSQHIVQFFADCKVVIKFIMDLLKYVMNIIKDVNQLVTIIRNGINNAGEIFTQLMKLMSLEWLVNLVYKIQNKFNSVISSTIELLENTLEPVYFEDTDKYEEMMDAMDTLIEQELPEGMTTKNYVNKIFSYVAGNSSLTDGLSSVLSFNLAKDIYNGTANEDDIDKLSDELDNMGKTIVAYRSPFFKRNNSGDIITTNSSGGTTEPELEGYLYYHPDLYHYSSSSFGIFGKSKRRRKSRFIQKAAKRSNKTNGGVNMLKNKSKLFYDRSSHQNVSAWDAFYWYKVTTSDFDVDFLGTDNTETNISKVVFNTSNGSVVLIDLGNGNTQKVFVKDANVKSGDYVNYNGQKYKIL